MSYVLICLLRANIKKKRFADAEVKWVGLKVSRARRIRDSLV